MMITGGLAVEPMWLTESLASCPIMGVFRGLSPGATVELAATAWDAGVVNVEVPIESPAAIPSLVAAVKAGASRGLKVGAGTIVTLEQLQTAETVGAAYGVSPGLDLELLAAAAARGFPLIPGVATASELLRAQQAGCTWIKAFPASVLTPGWFSAMKGPFPTVNIIATGGVTGRNAGTFLAAGASVAGVGGAFRTLDEIEILRSLINAHSIHSTVEP